MLYFDFVMSIYGEGCVKKDDSSFLLNLGKEKHEA